MSISSPFGSFVTFHYNRLKNIIPEDRATITSIPKNKSNTDDYVVIHPYQLANQCKKYTEYHYLIIQGKRNVEDWGYIHYLKMKKFISKTHVKMYMFYKKDCIQKLPEIRKIHESFNGYESTQFILPPFENWMTTRIKSYHNPELFLNLITEEDVKKDLITYAWTKHQIGDTLFFKTNERKIHQLRLCYAAILHDGTNFITINNNVFILGHNPKQINRLIKEDIGEDIFNEKEDTQQKFIDQILDASPPCISSTIRNSTTLNFKENYHIFDILHRIGIKSDDFTANQKFINDYKKYQPDLNKACSGCPSLIKKGYCPYGSIEDIEDVSNEFIYECKKACLKNIQKKNPSFEMSEINPTSITTIRIPKKYIR
jgi:hypothetical protein